MDRHQIRASFNAARQSAERLGQQAVDQAKRRAAEAGLDVDGLEHEVRSKQADAAALAARTAERVANNPRGRSVQESTEAVSRRLAGIPVLSLGSDVVQARYDLRGHVERLKADPRSIDQLVLTANAVREVEIGLARYRMVKAVNASAQLATMNAAPAAMHLSARLAGRLAENDSPPPVDSLLKAAFSLSVDRLRSDPCDARAHYCLARIYLLTDNALPAALSARAAVRTTTDDQLAGDALTALAFAKLSSGSRQEADRAARLAIDRRVSTGYVVLAELAESDTSLRTTDRSAAAAQHRRLVLDVDRDRYFGARPPASAVAGAVWKAQRDKGLALRDQARQAVQNRPASSQGPPLDFPPPDADDRRSS